MRNNFLKTVIFVNLLFVIVGCTASGVGYDYFNTGATTQKYDLETKERLGHERKVIAHVVYNKFISIGPTHPTGISTTSSLHFSSIEEFEDKSNPFIPFLAWANDSYEQRERTKNTIFEEGVLVVDNYNGPHIWTVDNDKETKEPLLIEQWKQNWWSLSQTHVYTVSNAKIILASAVRLEKNLRREKTSKKHTF